MLTAPQQLANSEEEYLKRLRQAAEMYKGGQLRNLKPLLPLLLNLKGKPYHIRDHFPFEPFFSTQLPRKIVLKCGRQLSKSTSIASQSCVQTACIPHFSTLFVLPLFELTRRFSSNYVRPFIDGSPVRKMFVDSSSNMSVLQRSFINQSVMHFSFCFTDADRIRGIASDKVAFDEAQDLDPAHIPVIRETMSASQHALEQYTGTPKTFDGCLEQQWLQSSQAEWVVKCMACGHWNIPALEHDLDKMLGPTIVTREISEDYPGVVCAKCQRPIYPRTGHWLHKLPERRYSFAGYHVPQCIVPMHYANSEKWAIFQGKRQGFGNTPINTFHNECLGESCDVGAKLLTITDLKAAATLHRNDYNIALANSKKFKRLVLAVDWGGGGAGEQSFTVAAVLGFRADGKIEVIYGWRSLTPHDHYGEARYLIKLMVDFKCGHMVHDFCGAGAARETIMVMAGVPQNRLLPISYIRASAGPMMKLVPENQATGQRMHYRVDKARSLVTTCNLVRSKWIRFFAYDYEGAGREGLLHDFLSLVEDKVDSRSGSDIYTIIRNAAVGPDDFAQAVNIGVCALYYQEGKWPDVSRMDLSEKVTRQIMANVAPIADSAMWDNW